MKETTRNVLWFGVTPIILLTAFLSYSFLIFWWWSLFITAVITTIISFNVGDY